MGITLTVQHEIRDYDTWRPAFDRDAGDRQRHGCSKESVYRSVDDPNDLVIVMEFSSRDGALAFLGDPELKAAMQAAGVASQPHVVIREALAAQPV